MVAAFNRALHSSISDEIWNIFRKFTLYSSFSNVIHSSEQHGKKVDNANNYLLFWVPHFLINFMVRYSNRIVRQVVLYNGYKGMPSLSLGKQMKQPSFPKCTPTGLLVIHIKSMSKSGKTNVGNNRGTNTSFQMDYFRKNQKFD